MKQLYLNPMQRDVLTLGANTNVVVAGRGTGKSVLQAAILLQCFQQMPRCTVAIVAQTASRALTNTLPSMLTHWEAWGYRRGVHWEIGKRPPARLGWPLPLYAPEQWSYVISFYTGACAQIISQDRLGTSNSKSFDFVAIDEAKFINFDRLKDETLPANRGNRTYFGTCPLHHGLLITSDMPVTRRGAWFMRYEGEHNPDAVATLRAMNTTIAALRADPAVADQSAASRQLQRLEDARAALQQRTTFFARYSSLTNLPVLGESFIRQMKRDLPPLVFRTSIMCLPVEQLRDGFYSSMQPHHKYTAADYHYLDTLGTDFTALSAAASDCRADGDVNRAAPLCIAFDFNANINWLVCGQPFEDERKMRTLKSFYTKYERKLPELVNDFCDYYAAIPLHEVVVYYDSTALGSNYAVNSEDFLYVITTTLQRRGWRARPVAIGAPMNHMEKYALINRAFAGQTRLTPYFNQDNNRDLLISIQTAGVYNGKKDKRGEKLAETDTDRLEARTDGSDAWDTLYIGCEKFPQSGMTLSLTSDFR